LECAGRAQRRRRFGSDSTSRFADQIQSGVAAAALRIALQAEPSQIADDDLLQGVSRGDESALAALYDRYRLILFGLILRILHDRHEAEDVLQEAFLQVWRRAKDFDPARGRAFTWLVTIARSRALDRLRMLGSRSRFVDTDAEAASDQVIDTAQELVKSEAGQIVRRALRELPAEQRRTLLLAYFEGLTQAEIAERLGDPLGTVKTRMRSGLIKLRELLRDRSRDLA
jgi:RNA polymerase sigma-70 factor, ECF subfamily